MKTILEEPYPAPGTDRRAWITPVAIGVFVFAFLFVFQPFELNYLPVSRRLGATLGYGGVTLVVLLLFFQVLPGLLPARFANEGWTVGRHILFITVAITVVAVGNLLWGRALGFFPLTVSALLYTVVITFAVGLFPAFAFTALSYIRYLKRYDAAQVTLHDTTAAGADALDTVPERVLLIAENEKDRLELAADALLYLESADNYTQVVYRRPTDGAPTRTLLRGSLTRFEQQVGLPYVRRCHRSYVVNLRQVERISGNAQGYKLHLHGVETPVPVARRYAEEVVR